MVSLHALVQDQPVHVACFQMALAFTQDAIAMLWDLTDAKRLYTLDANDIIHALCFSPNRYWLCAATQSCIKVCPSCCAPPSLKAAVCCSLDANGLGRMIF